MDDRGANMAVVLIIGVDKMLTIFFTLNLLKDERILGIRFGSNISWGDWYCYQDPQNYCYKEFIIYYDAYLVYLKYEVAHYVCHKNEIYSYLVDVGRKHKSILAFFTFLNL